MKSKHNNKSDGKKAQLKGPAQDVARNPDDTGKGEGANGKREKKLAKLAQRKK